MSLAIGAIQNSCSFIEREKEASFWYKRLLIDAISFVALVSLGVLLQNYTSCPAIVSSLIGIAGCSILVADCLAGVVMGVRRLKEMFS